MLVKGAPSVKPCYSQNVSWQQRPIVAYSSRKARMTSDDNTGAWTSGDSKVKTIGDEVVLEISLTSSRDNSNQGFEERSDFELITKPRLVLLFELLNIVLLACSLAL